LFKQDKAEDGIFPCCAVLLSFKPFPLHSIIDFVKAVFHRKSAVLNTGYGTIISMHWFLSLGCCPSISFPLKYHQLVLSAWHFLEMLPGVFHFYQTESNHLGETPLLQRITNV